MIDSNLLNAEGFTLDWTPVGDPVMGGRSDSRIDRVKDAIVFYGTVSFENNGGFASIETPVRVGTFAGASAVELQIIGDGNTYRLRVKTPALGPGESYQCLFRTLKGQLCSIRLEFSKLESTRRGREAVLPDLEPGHIDRLGFMIADEQEGSFRLIVETVRPVS